MTTQTVREPIVDIVVLVHDQMAWASLTVQSIESFTKNPFRLIVVDNASVEPATHVWLKEVEKKGHTVIRLAENRSFSNGFNAGISAGSSKFIVIHNSDALATEGWDSAILQDASDKHTGLVGARSNYISGAQGDPNWPAAKEPPFLIFVCVALRRDVWNAVGPLDEVTFDGFSSEDLDYSWRVKKAGFKLKVSNAYVLHAGSRTICATVGAGDAMVRNNQKYNARLIDKWGKQWVKDNSQFQSRGLVVTYHAENWTRVEFLKNLMGLRRSDGVGFEYLQVSRAPIQLARQLAADFALDNGFDWFVQLDDDATFPSDVLRRLLAHNKDVVCALAYQRKPPHLTCAFEIAPDGLLGNPLEGIEHTGLRRVDVSGYHCSIMKTSVIQRLRDGTKDAEGKVLVPGIRQYFGGFDNKVGEDFSFSFNLKKLGIQIHCDTDLVVGHIGNEIIVDEAFKKDWVSRGSPR